ncbi:PAS domain S-box protein [Algoriphagus winogradskyi]|uniref:histidine kinase n=1 Tax=Algoriphagus winogradskyi TaxID=237017 RepID=A0ABY1P1I8_9BACT|nr:PAS domain S-box protein [Algoriphagus winogradskyi]SMP22954.1 PAS domain S-box-containing protein [Algoriphagus winogradskyi]
MSTPTSRWNFFSKNNTLGEHYKNIDWKASPLGDVAEWPVSLLTTISMIMEHPLPMCIFWGDDFVKLYNDNYAEILGDTSHASLLGKSAKESDREKWAKRSGIFNKVMEGNSVQLADSMIATSGGVVSNKFYDFNYSPIRDLKGNIGGVLCTAVEITDKKIVEEKLIESKDQLHFAIDAAGLGTWDYNPANNTFTGNEKLKSWFGLAPEEEINLEQALSAIVPEDKSRVTQAIQNALLYESGGNYNIEYAIINPNSGERRIVHAKGKAWFTDEKIGYRLNGTLEDVTQQVQARKAIEESEQSIRSIVANAPFPIGVYEGKDLIITLANQSILDVWGKGNDVIGKSYKTILPELENQEIFDQVYGVFSTGIPFHAKNQKVDIMIEGVLLPFYFNYSFTPLYNTAGEIYGVMNTAAEVTDIHLAKQKIEESEKRFKNSVKQAPLGITILRGDDYTVEMANENYLLLVDKSEEEFIGKPLFETLPEVQEVIEDIFLEIKRTGKPFFGNEFPVTMNRYGKHESTYFNFVYHPLKEQSGEISAIMVVATEVTATVKAKHLLQESEKHFRSMVMQSPIPMTILRGENHIIDSANKVMFESVWRRKPADVIGIPIIDAFPELEAQKYPELLKKVYTSGKAHSEKESIAIIAGDNGVQKFYFDFEYAPLYDTEGKVWGIMITVNDVTDKVEARLKVEENEERLNIVISASGLGVWEFNLKTEESIISNRCYEIMGVSGLEKVSNAQLMEKFHPDDLETVKLAYEKAYKTGSLLYESRVLRDDSERCWIEVRGKVFFDQNNEPERIVGTIRDITEEKNFHKLLLEREEKFRLLADSMPQIIWTSDRDGKVNYFNQAVYIFTGLSADELISDGWAQMVHPDDRKKNIEKWAQSISSGKDYHFEHRFRKADGTYRWQLSRAIPQRDDQGNIKMWVGSSTDIQDQKLFANELEKQVKDRTKELQFKNIELEKMNKELQSFAYISSHDLQEPLRKIQTFTSLLLDDEYDNISAKGKDMFDRMQNAAQRMQTLIQDLLVYSRTNTQERVFEEVSFSSIINEIIDNQKEELQYKEATLDVNAACRIRVIPFQFKQLLMNLTSNALKFSDPSRKVLIGIKCQLISGENAGVAKLDPEQMYNWISFSDNGIGFDPSYSEKIFEVFQRLHGKAEYAGTGIGLAIVKKIVDNHNGFIQATGELGKGATFDIYIPA